MNELEMEGVAFTYQDEHGPAYKYGDVAGINLVMNQGESLVILGQSGCGKSTLLQLAAGFIFPQKGRVLWKGEPVAKPNPDREMVFQRSARYPWLTVTQNVEFGPKMRGVRKAARRGMVVETLESLRLVRYAAVPVYKISDYHLLMRISLARCLVNDPSLLIIDDEPFGELDDVERTRLQEVLLDIWNKKGKMILMATHDVEEALCLSGRLAVVGGRPGRIVREMKLPFAQIAAADGIRAVRRSEEFSRTCQEILGLII